MRSVMIEPEEEDLNVSDCVACKPASVHMLPILVRYQRLERNLKQ